MKGTALLLLIFAVGSGAVSAAFDRSADLEAGIRQIDDGDFENGLLTLDAVIQDLASSPERSSELARACLYAGVAYLGLGQESLAKAKFRQALRAQPDLRLDPGQFAAKTLRLFASAREAEQATSALQKDARRSRGKGGLLLLGLGGAAAAGLTAVAVTRERDNAPPSVAIAVVPQGQAIAGVTQVGFTASGSDPEGDPLSYSWDFGDGGTATGPSAVHVFPRTGEQRVTLTVRDGLASTTLSVTVTVGTLFGTWRVAGQIFFKVAGFRLEDSGRPANPSLTVEAPDNQGANRNHTATLHHARRVIFDYQYWEGPQQLEGLEFCGFLLEGEADAALRSISGRVRCGHRFPNSCLSCNGQEQPVVLNRQ